MEDEAICRVCRSESTHDHPLFHPCKCSGSIRFVHQDCLIEWLSHSRKKYCELCEYPFTFTPIYRADMPARLPVSVFIRQCARRLAQYLKTLLRALLVGIVWLVILPYSTLCTWRFYFWSGETISFFANSTKNVTLPEQAATADAVPTSLISRLFNFMTFPVVFQWRTFLTDCFEGQVITAFVIVIFIAAYLFREWAMQNLPLEENQDEDEAIDHHHQQQQQHEQQQDQHQQQQQQQQRQQQQNLRANLPLFNRPDEVEDDDQIREQQQVAIDTLLNAIQNINTPNNDLEAERNELHARLAEMRRVLEEKRNSDDDQQASSNSAHNNSNDNNASFGGEASWLSEDDTTSTSNNDQPSGSSQRRNGKQPDTTYLSDKEEEDEEEEGKEEEENMHFGNGLHDGNDNDHEHRSYRAHRFSRDVTIADWYDDLNDSDEDSRRPQEDNQRWRVFNYSDEDEDNHDESSRLSPRYYTPDAPIADTPTNQHAQPPPYAHAPAPPVMRPPPAAPAAIMENNNMDENEDGGEDEMEPFDFGDDIDGVLEAVGMRGNPWMLLQNSVLMSLMVSLCLGVAVWIPYVVGRLVISIKPMSFIQTPISVMRLLTDPVVDFVLDRGIPLLWTWVMTKMTVHEFVPESIVLATDTLVTKLHNVVDDYVLTSGSAALASNSIGNALSTTGYNNTTMDHALPWDSLQQRIEAMGDVMLKRWQQFALGQSGLDRAICILVGYFVLVLIGSWYLGRTPDAQRRQQQQQRRNANNNGNINMNINVRRAGGQRGDTIQDILRQQGDFLKVVFFIVVELVIFPLACGVLLDGCTLPLFVDASVATRWAFYQTNPYSSCFLHWFFGTGFLFGVAVFVALCREVVRPGVIWFIRDPNDPQFHPIREMIERPTLPLLQKIMHSAMMYAGLIVAAVGTVVYSLDYMTSAFPLFVPLDSPFSTLPLDLLGVQFLLSPLISYLEPREYAKFMLDTWWRWTSRQLRLTSFMFNGRYPEEEGSHVRRTFRAWILRQKAPIPSGDDDDHVYGDVGITSNDDTSQTPVIFQRNGQLLRVPKLDTVPVVPRRRMLVPVDPVTLEPLDEEERRLGHPAASQSGDEELSTTIVYAPPHFKSRLILFIVLMWLSSSLLTCTLTVVPVCFGRYLFKSFVTEKSVHDVYNFAVGAYVMVSMGLAIDWIVNKYHAWQENDATSSVLLEWSKTKLQLCAKVLYLAFTLGFVLPLMLGVAVDLYLFMPIRYSIHDQPMVLHLSEDWTFGIAYASIIYGLIQVLPDNQWQQYFEQFIGNGFVGMSPWLITRSFLAPVLLGTILAITIPGILAWGCVQWLDDASRTLVLVRWMYPIVFCTLFVGFICYVTTKLIKLWVKSIRDDTYMIGKQLHNLD